ncbi:MAG: type 1 glutamine amidotransferase, partial [Chlorobium sp.]|jgi:GMP synthase (glutamine-hydrolysing)|nr:type 1 glutamine amidotransferase [Chlorobium sp.]
MTRKLLIVKNMTQEGSGLLEPLLSEHGIAWHQEDLSAGGTFPEPRGYSALVVLGGYQSANDDSPAMLLQLRRIKAALHEEIPVLGICLGMQCLVKAGGGKVIRACVKETGFIDPEGNPYRIELTPAGRKDPLFAGLGSSFPVFQLHGETVELAASGVELLATGKHCPVQAVRVGKNAYGLQCHFELTPEMFSEWCDIDADLKRMDRNDLMKQFETIREEYHSTGLKLLKNFLRISGLV